MVDSLPHVDILINNLGIFGAHPALEITDDEWRRDFEVNVLAAGRLTRAYLQGMRDNGWGRIQYIASDLAVAVPAEMIHYGMSKTAVPHRQLFLRPPGAPLSTTRHTAADVPCRIGVRRHGRVGR